MDRKGWLLAVVLGAWLVGPVAAGPACVTQGLDMYMGLGDAGCTIGVFTLKDFDNSSLPSTVPASAITVEPFAGPTGPRLEFSSTAFSVGAGYKAVLDLIYNIDPPPIIIRGFDEEMSTDTPVAPGFVTIDTWLCVGGTFPDCTGIGEVGPPQLLLHLAHYGLGNPDNVLRDSIVFSPTSILGVWHIITLDASTGGSASFTALGNQAYTVPEPGTWLLLGCGLLSLAVLRRRRAG